MDMFKKKRFVGHGNGYDRIFRAVLGETANFGSEGPLADGISEGTKKAVLQGSEKAIDNILKGEEDTKTIIRRTGNDLKKKLGTLAKMKLKKAVFKPGYSTRKKALKAGSILYSLNRQKSRRTKSAPRKKPFKKANGLRGKNNNKKSQKRAKLYSIPKKSRKLPAKKKKKNKKETKKGKLQKKEKKNSKVKTKNKKVRFLIPINKKRVKSQKPAPKKKRAKKLFPTVFDI